MVYKLNKMAIKLILKIETRNRPVLYTNIYLDSDLNFFCSWIIPKCVIPNVWKQKEEIYKILILYLKISV